jgi:hypothetical protein
MRASVSFDCCGHAPGRIEGCLPSLGVSNTQGVSISCVGLEILQTRMICGIRSPGI